MMRIARMATMVLAAAVVSTTGVSRAQDDPASRARIRFLEGRKAAEAGDYVKACSKFAESAQLEAAAGTLFNLGDCEEQMGRAAAAWTAYRRGLELLASKADRRRRHVEERLAALEKQIARLTIRTGPNAPDGTTVEQDGSAVDGKALGVEQAVEPGKHVVMAAAAGRPSGRYAVTLEPGKAAELSVEPEPAAAAPRLSTTVEAVPTASATVAPSPPGPKMQGDSATAMTTESRPGGASSAGIVVSSVGAAGVVLGVVTRVLAFGKKDAIDAHCSAVGACDQTGMDAVSSINTLQTVSTVSLIAGAAGLGVGAYLVFGSGGGSPSAASAQASLGAMALPGGVALRFQKGF